jgi:hypothetical protein
MRKPCSSLSKVRWVSAASIVVDPLATGQLLSGFSADGVQALTGMLRRMLDNLGGDTGSPG